MAWLFYTCLVKTSEKFREVTSVPREEEALLESLVQQ